MTDKVQKIKDWISKEQDGLMDAQGNFEYPEHEGAYHILCNLDTYIDSLQEEPVSIWHDASEEPKPNMELICIGQYGNPLVLSSNSDSFKSRIISKWAYFNDLLNLSNVQRTVKDWKEEPVSEDLEEAASQYPNVIRTISPQWESEVENAFKAGAEWQKEQMMKDAVYGLVCGHDESSPAWIDLNLLNKPNVKVGTEVKLIIIKDE